MSTGTRQLGGRLSCEVLRVYDGGPVVVALDDDDAAPNDPALIVVHDVDTRRVTQGMRAELVRHPSGWLGDFLLVMGD